MWRKHNATWPVCGIPDVLYVDHGSDFTSAHLDQVAADLRFQVVYSSVGRPQGRGKVERLFGTLNTECLADLPGYLSQGKPATPPRLSLPELDATIGDYFLGTYNNRLHRETGMSPLKAWLGQGWLPRMPESLEALALLLVMVAQSRIVRRDGVHFQGLRYLDPTLAAYVGEPVTIRYDPRDIAEIRGFHRNRFICRAIHPEHAGRTVTLKDKQRGLGTAALSGTQSINGWQKLPTFFRIRHRATRRRRKRRRQNGTLRQSCTRISRTRHDGWFWGSSYRFFYCDQGTPAFH